MGGNAGSVGNGLGSGLHLPHTQYVPNLKGFVKDIRRNQLFRHIPGKRTLDELLASLFIEDYPDPDDLEKVVAKSLDRMKAGFVPTKLIEQKQYDDRFNEVAMGK